MAGLDWDSNGFASGKPRTLAEIAVGKFWVASSNLIICFAGARRVPRGPKRLFWDVVINIMAFTETNTRSITKSITFRVLIVVADLIFVYALTHHMGTTIAVTVLTNISSTGSTFYMNAFGTQSAGAGERYANRACLKLDWYGHRIVVGCLPRGIILLEHQCTTTRRM